MLMETKCPHCGCENIVMDVDREECVSDTEMIVNFDCRCGNCKKTFIISEVRAVTSRIVAKDNDELDELIDKELKEE